MTEKMTNINQAFLEAQKKIKPVKKDGTNPYFNSRYATLSAVFDNVKEVLNEAGFSILQPVMGDKVKTRLLFTDGTTIEDEGTPIVCKVDNDPQAQGSAITYARRYGLMSLLGLPADDDDAESATGRGENVTPRPQPKTETKVAKSNELASEAQIRAIFAISKSKGVTEEELKEKFHFESMKTITKDVASNIISGLNLQK